MRQNKIRLGDHLLALKLITVDQLNHALSVQRESPAPLGAILVSLGAISEDLLLNALAAQMGVTPWRLDENPPSENAVRRLPPHLCRSHQVIPVKVQGDLLLLGMKTPDDIDAIDLVRNFTGLRVEPVLVNPERLEYFLDVMHGSQSMASKVDEVVDRALKDFNVDGKYSNDNREYLNEEDTRPVVELVNQILTDAIRSGASDLHIEPRMDRVEIRHRVNGTLEKVRNIPVSLHPMVTTRLKVMAEIDIVESRLPQDGRISVNLDNRVVDLRLSVIPTQFGQRFVFRILDKALSVKKINEIGFSDQNIQIFQEMIHKPYGIILVTGPTGSGKSTTLYAALQELKSVTTNIMTVEDPIEYEIEGVSQTQVYEKINLTFATQLRAILRQDPDVIMVGEIRDMDTAQTAVRAALTGHLVLSTLHCNDAPSAVPRLMDMGLDAFLLSTALKGVVSQRLVRQLCTECRVPKKPDAWEASMLRAEFSGSELPVIYEAKGCARCNKSGYRGRTAVQEIMPVSHSLGNLIAAQAPLEQIRNEAFRYGYVTMTQAALKLVVEGKTSMQEIARMVEFDALEQTARTELRLAS